MTCTLRSDRNMIADILQKIRCEDYDPRHVEAWMRSEHPTLNHLSAERYTREVVIAVGLVRTAGPDLSESLARSLGIK